MVGRHGVRLTLPRSQQPPRFFCRRSEAMAGQAIPPSRQFGRAPPAGRSLGAARCCSIVPAGGCRSVWVRWTTRCMDTGDATAFAGALWLMCFGAALGGRYGVIGALGGGACGALIGFISGYALNFLWEELSRWLDKLSRKSRLIGRAVSFCAVILSVALFVASARVILRSLKEGIRAHRPKTALAPQPPGFCVPPSWRFGRAPRASPSPPAAVAQLGFVRTPKRGSNGNDR